MISSSSASRACARRSTNRADPLGRRRRSSSALVPEGQRAGRSAARRARNWPLSARAWSGRARRPRAGRADAAPRRGGRARPTRPRRRRGSATAHEDTEAAFLGREHPSPSCRFLLAPAPSSSSDTTGRWPRCRVPPSPPGTPRARSESVAGSPSRRAISTASSPTRTRRSRERFVPHGGPRTARAIASARDELPSPTASSARSRRGTSAGSPPARAHDEPPAVAEGRPRQSLGPAGALGEIRGPPEGLLRSRPLAGTAQRLAERQQELAAPLARPAPPRASPRALL